MRKLFLAALVLATSIGSAHGAGTSAAVVVAAPEGAVHLFSFWIVELKRERPNVDVRIEASNDAAVAEALIKGTAQAGLMLRPLNEQELAAYAARHGARPIGARVALDAIAVYVHRTNPLKGVTRAQLDAVFSTSRACGSASNVFWWDELGVRGEDWRIRQVELYGPNAQAGERTLFAESALCGGTHKATLEMARNQYELLHTVARNPSAIAYGGYVHREHGVRQVGIASSANGEFVTPTPERIRSGAYPLAHPVYLYTAASGPHAGTVAALMKTALSARGQVLAEMNGFVALPPAMQETIRAR